MEDIGGNIKCVIMCYVECEVKYIVIDVYDGIVWLFGKVGLFFECKVVCGVVWLVCGVCVVVDDLVID